MKILLVSHTFLPKYVGGTEVYAFNLAKEASKSNDVKIFTSNPLSSKKSYSVLKKKFKGLDIWEIQKDVRKYASFTETYLDKKLEKEFKKTLIDFKPDVVHFHHLIHLSVSLIDVVKRNNIPIVFTVHDYWLQCFLHKRVSHSGKNIDNLDNDELAWHLSNELNNGVHLSEGGLQSWYKVSNLKRLLSKVYARVRGKALFSFKNKHLYVAELDKRDKLVREALKQMDLVIFPSLYMYQRFSEWGFSTKKVIVSDNGIPLPVKTVKKSKKKDRLGENELTIGFIGAIVPPKGIDLIIQALKLIPDEMKVKLEIFGDLNSDKKYVSKLKRLSNGMNNVNFNGKFDNGDIEKIFDKFDVLVVPSKWQENAPVVIREAFNFSTPVLASDVGGVPEVVINSKNGFIFESENPQSLSKLIIDICSKKIDLSDLEFSKPKDIKEDAEAIIREYDRLIDSK